MTLFIVNSTHVLFFCMLIGGHFGPWIRSWKSGNTEANLGQCFIAIDPKAFEDEFEVRLQKLMDYCRALSPSG